MVVVVVVIGVGVTVVADMIVWSGKLFNHPGNVAMGRQCPGVAKREVIQFWAAACQWRVARGCQEMSPPAAFRSFVELMWLAISSQDVSVHSFAP